VGGASLDLYIVTGSSRGLGAALAEQVLSPATRLLAMARTAHPGLAAQAQRRQAGIEQIQVDLGDATPAARQLQRWLGQHGPQQVRSVTLINNAALLAPPGPVELASDQDLARVLRVDVEAPLILTAGWPGLRRVLLVSSGAGRRAFAGSASYCAAKAALDHFARAVALDEQRHGAQAARIVSLAPGVIDTDMQTLMRATDPSVFSERQFFVDLHQRGELATPQAAAARVLAYLAREDFGTQPVADVRDA
jgi:benzil reductase ((S)-benzoin forming)